MKNRFNDNIITKTVLEAGRDGNLKPLKSVPKTDLHAHAVLSAPFETYLEISAGKIRRPPERFQDLDHFLAYVKEAFFPIFTSVEIYRRIFRDAFAHMIADGIIYTEISFDLAMPLLLKKKTKWDELVLMLGEEIDRIRDKLVVCPELGLARDFPFDNWEDLVIEALDTGFFRSIDLYGSEKLKPILDFAAYFEHGRSRGLKIKFHGGETSHAQRLIDEFNVVKPDGVQHGVRAAEKPEALKLLAESKVDVNVCPFSNYLLNVVQNYCRHPIRQMFDAGIRVTVNSDDLAVFGRSVSEEYLRLYEAGIFSAEELEQIRQNGLCAFLNLDRR